MLSPAASEKSVSLHQLIHKLPQCTFMQLGDPIQHKFVLLSKTNLSPAEETLKNAADAENRTRQNANDRLLEAG